MDAKAKPATIDDYLAGQRPEVREILEQIRQTVREAVPTAEETIGYQMPAFRLERIFFYFAVFKKHIGVYPPVTGDAALVRALVDYRGEKGNLKFPLDQPIPYALIGKVAKSLAKEYG